MTHDCDNVQTSALISLDTAIHKLLEHAIATTHTESIPLIEALGRTLAEDIFSTINVPPCDNSAMDGYAVRYEDLKGDSNTILPVSQRICAGEMGNTLQTGSAARIFTGAPIPDGADTVIMQEYCSPIEAQVKIQTGANFGANIRRAGEDIQQRACILKKGHTLRPQDLGLAASVGIAEVCVFQRLKVGIFFTGNELRQPGEILEDGQIYNSNRYTLSGLLQNFGCDIIDLGIVEDSLEATKAAMLAAAEQADLIMTSGGVSVGEEDYVRLALEALGQLTMWRINIKPGKPLAFGHINNTPFLGLPGNPVSVFATFCILARPFVLKLQGRNKVQARSFRIPASFDRQKLGWREEFMRARLETNSSGETVLKLYTHQGSGVLSSASWADGLVRIPEKTAIQKGDKLAFYSFAELFA